MPVWSPDAGMEPPALAGEDNRLKPGEDNRLKPVLH
jgi:hypothetical protein